MTSPQAKCGLSNPRDAYWTGFQITTAGAARVAGDIVVGNASASQSGGFYGDLHVGHIVQLDPWDLDGVGVGMAVSRPTPGYHTKLFVVTYVPKSVNETFIDTALGSTVRRRGGHIQVTPCDGLVPARISGAVVAAKVGVGATGSLQLDSTNTNGYEQYMNLVLGLPTTVAHLQTLMGAANVAAVVGLAMAVKGAGIALANVQFGGMLDQGVIQ